MRNIRRADIFIPKLLVAVLALAIISCSTGSDTRQVLKSGDTAPQFSGRDTTGELVSLSQFKGKVVVLYFWTNSCCADRLKQVEPYYRKLRQDGLAVVAIDVGDSRESVDTYARDNGLTFTMLTDERSRIFTQYGGIGFPTVFIIDKHGIIRKKVLGDIQAGQLEKLIQDQFAIQKETEAAYERMHRR